MARPIWDAADAGERASQKDAAQSSFDALTKAIDRLQEHFSPPDQPTFAGRQIILGPRAGDFYLVRHGLSDGERVVTRGNFKIDSALQISAKPSMMTPEGGGGGGHAHGGHGGESGKKETQKSSGGMELPLVMRRSLHHMMTLANSVKQLIANRDLDGSHDKDAKMQEMLAGIDAENVDGHARLVWKEMQMLLENDLFEGKAANRIPEAQIALTNLQKTLGRIDAQFGISNSDMGPKRYDVPSPFQQQLAIVWKNYLGLSSALAGDNAKAATQKSGELTASLAKVDMKLLKDPPAHMAWMRELANMKKILKQMSSTTDIKTQREQFASLSAVVQNKLVVALTMIAIVGWGILVAPFDWEVGGLPRKPVPVDAIPDIGENQQIVFTAWMGRSPQDVEDQIGYPLTVSLLGLPGVKTIRSYSFFGFSSIYIIFNEDVDFYWSRSRVLEKLNSLPAGTLPEGVQPALGPDATALGQIYWYTLEGRDPDGNPAGGWDLHELRTVQDWYVRYSLMSAEGVSECASIGGFVREYQVDVDPDAMRANNVTLNEIHHAVRMSNIDVGARTIELNKAEYVIRGLGFVKDVADLEKSVIKVNDNVPIHIRDVAKVTLGPALRRGALDKAGGEAVGGVVVVRYGFNPLAAIKNLKEEIKEISPGLPTKAVVDYRKTTRADVRRFAKTQDFKAYQGQNLNQKLWLQWLRSRPVRVNFKNTSHDEVAKFAENHRFDAFAGSSRAQAAEHEHSGHAAGKSDTERHPALNQTAWKNWLKSSDPDEKPDWLITPRDQWPEWINTSQVTIVPFYDRTGLIYETLGTLNTALTEEILVTIIVVLISVLHLRSSFLISLAVLTAVATTVVSFLPVFTMVGAEGKLFRPLAFTKTFALIASVIVALTVIPPMAHLLFGRKVRARIIRQVLMGGLALAGIAVGVLWAWWAGAILAFLGVYRIAEEYLPEKHRRYGTWLATAAAVGIVGMLLAEHWLPLGPEKGLVKNLIFVAVLLGGLLLFFQFFQRVMYEPLLRWCLKHKILFLMVPATLVLVGLAIWQGPSWVFGRIPQTYDQQSLKAEEVDELSSVESFKYELAAVRKKKWQGDIEFASRWEQTKWSIGQSWDGLGKEFMPPLDEGSYLYMPTTMPHASIGEAMDVLRLQDRAITAIPEVESVVGKIGRVESALDPAPISMIETIISYKPEYITDKDGHRVKHLYDEDKGEFVRDDDGNLIPDSDGRPYRLWRDHIRKPDDIWDEIVKAAEVPGTTSAPKLQPIAARIVMLQSGMRAPMGIKVKGPDLDTIEKVALDIERLLKQVPSVQASAVIADRVVGKPYLNIEPDRDAMKRYGLKMR
eukprot:g5237.t1